MANADRHPSGWNFDNSYARLPGIFYTRTDPEPVRLPEPVLLNRELALSLGLDIARLESAEGTAGLCGNRLPPGSFPVAQAYAGHQFGSFTMLGDGRALLLGEQIGPDGGRSDIVLKGSGRTPYSRGGDGRAALGPMLREYLIGEAMHALGIPTTRSLAVVAAGEPVYRETVLPGAVLTRVAAGHIRVGTFEFASRRAAPEEFKILADYTIRRFFSVFAGEEDRFFLLLKEVVRRQASLIAKWQLAGFVHGVMNTDNMSLAGETIDYGPCAFMDTYDPKTVFSSIDVGGRYAYGRQPGAAAWNLARFAETLLPLLHRDRAAAVEKAQQAVYDFTDLFHSYLTEGMRAKLGLAGAEPEDEMLISGLLGLMQSCRADYTNTFLALTFGRTDDTDLFRNPEFQRWLAGWKSRTGGDPDRINQAFRLMKDSNPAVIPRNHRVEEALASAVDRGDYGALHRLLHVLSNPYAHTPEQAEYALPPPDPSEPYRTYCGT